MKNKKLQRIIGIVLTTLTIVTVFFAIKASAEGQTLIDLENKAANLQAENDQINSEIVNSTSLSAIGKEAQATGMISPQKYAYMKGTGVAMR